jgi:alpha-L-fucosidase
VIDTASKGGNYLLNIGPTAEGVIPAPSVERLERIGKWMKVNGEAIYGTTAGPFKTELPWGRATSKRGKLYLHVFDWPADGVLNVPGYAATVTRAYLLADPKKPLTTEAGADGLRIKVPASAPDPVATVIVLETKS